MPATRSSGFGPRLTAFVADLGLLALFLTFGLTCLNIFVQVIVLVVGIFREANNQLGSLSHTVGAPESGRLTTDLVDLGVALVSALVAGVVYWGALRLRRRFMHLFVASSYETFVSKRYLISRQGGRLVSLISVVSVLGVAVGVMALIVVISVMQGFDQTLVKKFMGVFSHIEVRIDSRFLPDTNMPKERWEELLKKIEQVPEVTGVAPILNHQTAVQLTSGTEERREFAMFRGIDPEREKNVTEFLGYVEKGKAIPEDREIVMGAELARRLGVDVGDKVVVIGKIVATANRTAPKTGQMTVAGIFRSGLYDVDDRFVYTTIPTLQRLLLLDDEINGIHIRIKDPERVNEVGKELLDILPYGYGYVTWQMINPQFFEALWIEKVAMFIILLLIVLVAALNIIGTLVMTVVQKTRDIGILKSMGAENSGILKIFLLHGFLIGLLGTSLGTVWGLRLCRFVQTDIDKIFELPPGVYGLDRLPVVIDPGIIALMAGSAMVICIVASIIPAWQAARLNPVEALRHDG
ncbi:FtsX-like permease family protein [bacterium]|nr:FtsX-like permease family protein [bacterium]